MEEKPMKRHIKIVVTDIAGDEHIFNEEPGDVEHYLELNPQDGQNNPDSFISVTTRCFNGGEKYTSESTAWFFKPRRIDVIYGPWE